MLRKENETLTERAKMADVEMAALKSAVADSEPKTKEVEAALAALQGEKDALEVRLRDAEAENEKNKSLRQDELKSAVGDQVDLAELKRQLEEARRALEAEQ